MVKWQKLVNSIHVTNSPLFCNVRPQQVYDHLTGGTRIMPGYTKWVLHGENVDVLVVQGSSSIQLATDTAPI